MANISNITMLPTAAPKPVKSGKYVGNWGKRERLHPANTMPDERRRVRVMPNDSNGLTKPKNFIGKTKKEAIAKRDAWLNSLKNPVVVKPKPKKFSEWANKWYEVYSGEEDIGSKKSEVNLFISSPLGDMYMEDIQPADVQAIVAKFCYSKDYTVKIRRTLTRIFETAKDNGLIEKTPLVNINWVDSGTKSHRFLEQWERDLIIENWHKCAAGVGAMLMMFTGERPSEARAQSKKNITDEFILVRDSSKFSRSGRLILLPDKVKTEAGFRDIPIWPQLKDVLDYTSRHNSDLIWLSAENKPISKTSERRNWDSFMLMLRCIRTGLKPNKAGDYRLRYDLMPEKERAEFESLFKVARYSMRHTFCTMLYEAGVDLKTAQYLMGHRDAQTTLQIYTGLSDVKKTLGLDIAKSYFANMNKSNVPKVPLFVPPSL